MPGSSPIPISDSPLPISSSRKEEKKPRRFHIRKSLIETYGYTPGCKGCETALAGDPNVPARNHSEKCRRRIAEAIEKDEKRHLEDDVEMEVSENKRSKVDDDNADERLARKRASDVDVRELDAERNQRDEDLSLIHI